MKAAVFGESYVAGRVARDIFDSGWEVVRFPNAFEISRDLAECQVGICSQDMDASRLLAATAGCLERGVSVLAACQSEESWEALKTLSDEARSADLVVVAGVGWSPGITNLMARAGYEELDSPTEAKISWALSSEGLRHQMASARMVESLSGTVVSFESGSWIRSTAGDQEEQVFFPEPIGWRTVRNVSGLESLMLPASLPGIEKITVKGGMIGALADWMTRRASNLTRLSSAGSKRRAAEFLSGLIPATSKLTNPSRGWSALRVDLYGSRERQTRTVSLGTIDLMSNLEVVPLVTAALMMAAGEIKGSGVVSPEEVIEPGLFFVRLRERGIRVARLERDDPLQ